MADPLFSTAWPFKRFTAMPLKLHAVIRSTRPGRIGLAVAREFHGSAIQHG